MTLPPRATSTAACSAARKARSADHWVDFDFFGHQIVAHLAPGAVRALASNPLDGEDVPVPHFGAVLPMAEWERLAERLVDGGATFIIPPTMHFAGQAGEQAIMFLLDPAGNALEFKAMADPTKLFAK